MIMREQLIDTIQKMPDPYLTELYEIVKNFEAKKKKVESKSSLMSKLRKIEISGPEDFSQTADL